MKRLGFIVAIMCVLASPALRGQVNAEQVTRIGQNSLYFEDYVLAIQYFNQAIQAKPWLAKPWFYRAIAKYNLDDYAGAEADASKAIELNPFITDAWEVRGVARQNQGRNAEAIADYRHALELLPGNRQLMFNMALAQEQEGDHEGAGATYRELLDTYPGFANGYIGRARLYLAQGDTIAAETDISHALELNPNDANAYVMRADLAMKRRGDTHDAIADLNEAIRLQPKHPGLYINRAYLHYTLDDYDGAMDDYDRAIAIDPVNQTALFNRALLLSEVADNDHALADYTRVLQLNPDEHRARYNRAVTYMNKGMYREAVADINQVIDRFPDMAQAWMMRAELQRKLGHQKAASTDREHALALVRKASADYRAGRLGPSAPNVPDTDNDDLVAEADDPEAFSRRFATLLTVDNAPDIREEFNNANIRGKVQDRDVAISPEPLIELAYHYSPTELRESPYYIPEVDRLNSSRALRYGVVVTVRPPAVNDSDLIADHFKAVDYHNAYLATHTPRAIDHIGRALHLATLRNYAAAITDLDRAAELTPDFAPIYMLRAQCLYHALHTDPAVIADAPADAHTRLALREASYDRILSDLDRAISLSPRMAQAWYNRGCIHLEMADYPQALADFSQAISLQPGLGEAWYNRGFTHLRLGARDSAAADLSKAGEMGVLAAYNLLKRTVGSR